MKNNKGEWVSVEEIPALGSNKEYPDASNDVWLTDGLEVKLGFYEGGWFDAETDDSFDDFEPTHWQPQIIPAPPSNTKQINNKL